jgi:hypothetical protein
MDLLREGRSYKVTREKGSIQNSAVTGLAGF